MLIRERMEGLFLHLERLEYSMSTSSADGALIFFANGIGDGERDIAGEVLDEGV